MRVNERAEQATLCSAVVDVRSYRTGAGARSGVAPDRHFSIPAGIYHPAHLLRVPSSSHRICVTLRQQRRIVTVERRNSTTNVCSANIGVFSRNSRRVHILAKYDALKIIERNRRATPKRGSATATRRRFCVYFLGFFLSLSLFSLKREKGFNTFRRNSGICEIFSALSDSCLIIAGDRPSPAPAVLISPSDCQPTGSQCENGNLAVMLLIFASNICSICTRSCNFRLRNARDRRINSRLP